VADRATCMGDGAQICRQATDKAEAAQAISRIYLPIRLDLLDRATSLDMELAGIRLGAVTAGRLSFGRNLRIATGDAQNLHVNVSLQGQAVSSSGTVDPVATAAGQAAVFPPGHPASILWAADCVQLCLMVPQANVDAELERLLGRSIHKPLRFESRHVENLLLDGLLLSQTHNYTEALTRSMNLGYATPVARAIELLQERPEESWTTARLASAVHMSVRALQMGFSRNYDMSPMTYLRYVRLRRVRAALADATPGVTTIQSVATKFGFLHLSRFSAYYRDAFGENPSETLRREPR
jgi:AraC-like DNA-binding protein